MTATTELAEVVGQIDAMVGAAYPPGSARERAETGRFDRAAWTRVAAESGLVGLHLSTGLGGQDQPFAVTAAVAAALGRRVAPAPHLGVLGPAVRVLAEGSPEQRELHLAPVLDGRLVVAVAGLEGGIGGRRGDLTTSGERVSGALPAVVDADVADLLVVLGEAVAHVVDLRGPGVRVTPLEGLDLTRGRAEVVLDDAPVTRIDLALAVVERAVVEATCLLAAESAAGAAACLDAALDYARLRHQFGRPIGSFQALQHSLVDLYGDVVTAGALVDVAVEAVDAHDAGPESVEAVRVAAVAASEAYRRAARDNVHAHGGIGFTWEHDAHLHLRRALTDRPLLGDPVSHRRALGHLAVARAH